MFLDVTGRAYSCTHRSRRGRTWEKKMSTSERRANALTSRTHLEERGYIFAPARGGRGRKSWNVKNPRTLTWHGTFPSLADAVEFAAMMETMPPVVNP